MTIAAKTYFHLEIPFGGEVCRFDLVNTDGTARVMNLPNQTKDDKIITLPDLGTGLTKTLWSTATSHLESPVGIAILVDPDNAFADNLLRTAFTSGYAPVLTIEISMADAVAGIITSASSPANETVAMCIDVYREFPLIIPTCCGRAAITTATQTRVVSKIRGRSNMASGFGDVKIRVLPLG